MFFPPPRRLPRVSPRPLPSSRAGGSGSPPPWRGRGSSWLARGRRIRYMKERSRVWVRALRHWPVDSPLPFAANGHSYRCACINPPDLLLLMPPRTASCCPAARQGAGDRRPLEGAPRGRARLDAAPRRGAPGPDGGTGRGTRQGAARQGPPRRILHPRYVRAAMNRLPFG